MSDGAAQPFGPVVVTRSEGADGALTRELKRLGLAVLLWPAVQVTPGGSAALVAALERLGEFDWIVFTSRHAVAALTERIDAPPPGVRLAAVGAATAAVLRERGWPADLIATEPGAAGLLSAFAAAAIAPGTRILYPASSRALPTLAAGLTQLGAVVSTVEAYRTETAAPLDLASCRDWIARRAVGAVTFTSPSAVVELERALEEDFARLLATAPAVAIGPTTARALSERGQTPVLAESATLRGVANSVLRALRAPGDPLS